MVAFKFFPCILLLVLQLFSGLLSAQQSPPTPSVSQADFNQAIAAISTPNATSVSANGSAANTTAITSNSTLEIRQIDITRINSTLDTNTDDPKANISNWNSEFPQAPADGKKIYYANSTLNSPILNETEVNKNNTSVVNDTKIKCPSDMTVDESNLKATEVKTNTTKLVDTEVTDLLNNNLTTSYNVSDIPASPPNITLNITAPIDRDVELIDDGQNTEDELRIYSKHGEGIVSPGVPLLQGQLAAILAGVFVLICVVAYFGLLAWRRYLENRYGNRQMLINEDEFNDRDDMRHFTI